MNIRYIIFSAWNLKVTDNNTQTQSEDPCHVQIPPAVVSAALVQELCLVSEIKSL